MLCSIFSLFRRLSILADEARSDEEAMSVVFFQSFFYDVLSIYSFSRGRERVVGAKSNEEVMSVGFFQTSFYDVLPTLCSR